MVFRVPRPCIKSWRWLCLVVLLLTSFAVSAAGPEPGLVGAWTAVGVDEAGASFRTTVEFTAPGHWSYGKSVRGGPPELNNLLTVSCEGTYRFVKGFLRARPTRSCQMCSSCTICTSYCARYDKPVTMTGAVTFSSPSEMRIGEGIYTRR